MVSLEKNKERNGIMKINGVELDSLLKLLRSKNSVFYAKSGKDRTQVDCVEVAHRKKEIAYLELLQLIEEKRRLLTLIIELMETASHEEPKNTSIGLALSDSDWLMGIHTRINLVQTMKELEFFAKELAEYKANKENSNGSV